MQLMAILIPVMNFRDIFIPMCHCTELCFCFLFSPEKIDISMTMHLDQVKRKIPSTLLSWDAYIGMQEGKIII